MGKHEISDLTLFYLGIVRRYTAESCGEKTIGFEVSSFKIISINEY